MSTQAQPVPCDDRSSYVDRFGLLLALTVFAIIAQSLVDVRDPFGEVGSELGIAVVTVLVGAMFLLALRASGVTRKWQLIADLLVGVSIALVLGVLAVDVLTDHDFSSVHTDGSSTLWFVLAALTPIAAVRRLPTHRQVTRPRAAE